MHTIIDVWEGQKVDFSTFHSCKDENENFEYRAKTVFVNYSKIQINIVNQHKFSMHFLYNINLKSYKYLELNHLFSPN